MTYPFPTCLLEGDHGCSHPLANHEDWILTNKPCLLAELIVHVSECDIGRIVLKEAHVGVAGNDDGDVEVQVALVAFFLARHNSVKHVRFCLDL